MEYSYRDGNNTSGTNGHRPSSRDVTQAFVAAADVGADASGLFPRLFERGVEAHIVPDVFDTSIFKLALGSIGGVPLITLRSGAMTGLEALLKRMSDFVVSAILLGIAARLSG